MNINAMRAMRYALIALGKRDRVMRSAWAVAAIVAAVVFMCEKARSQDFPGPIPERYQGLPMCSDLDPIIGPGEPLILGTHAEECASQLSAFGETGSAYNCTYRDFNRNIDEVAVSFSDLSQCNAMFRDLTGRTLGRFGCGVARPDEDTLLYTLRYRVESAAQCATGDWVASTRECIVLNEPEECVCGDGLPPHALEAMGLPASCDREPAKICPDGSAVFADDTCPTSCSDFGTCLEEACAVNDCPAGQNITGFEHGDFGTAVACGTGPSLCTVNPEPDVTQDSSGCTGHDDCLAQACGAEATHCPGGSISGFLFSNGSEAIHCGTGASVCGTSGGTSTADGGDAGLGGTGAGTGGGITDNTDVTADEVQHEEANSEGTNPEAVADAVGEAADRNRDDLNAIGETIADGSNAVADAIAQASESGDENAAAIVSSNDRINATNQEGFEDVVEAIEGLVESDEEVDTGFFARVQDTPIMQMGGNLANSFAGGGRCPDLSLNLPVLDVNLSSTIHCQLIDENRTLLTPVILLVYSIVGFRIILSA